MMRSTERVKATRGLVAILSVLMAVGIPFGGCASRSKNASITYSTPTSEDDAFQKGANRPPTARTLYSLARILASQEKNAECEFILTKTIRQYPSFLPAYCDLAELYMRHQRTHDAMRTISVGLKVAPRDPTLLNNRGMCFMLCGEHDKALSMFTRATAVMPQNAKYRANMAAALGMMGRYDESLSLYSQVVRESDARHNLDILRRARGDSSSADTENNVPHIENNWLSFDEEARGERGVPATSKSPARTVLASVIPELSRTWGLSKLRSALADLARKAWTQPAAKTPDEASPPAADPATMRDNEFSTGDPPVSEGPQPVAQGNEFRGT